MSAAPDDERPGAALARFLWANRLYWATPLLLALALFAALLWLPATDVAPPFRY